MFPWQWQHSCHAFLKVTFLFIVISALIITIIIIIENMQLKIICKLVNVCNYNYADHK